jgi:hypothetical protein
MAETITKILIRQGTDIQRRTANLTGVVFNSGEPGYCVDTKRLYIGDGSTSGGNAIGIQNLGIVPVLFGNDTNGWSYEALEVFGTKGAAAGDIIYDRDTRSLYALSSVTSFPPTTADLVQYDFSTLINASQFEYNTSKQLQIKNGGIGPTLLSLTNVDGETLTKPSLGAPIAVKENGITNLYLDKTPSNSIKGNFREFTETPQDFSVPPNTVVGRTATSNLTAFPFSTALNTAVFGGQNGVLVDQTGTIPIWKLDPALITLTSTAITLKKNSFIQGFIDITGNTIVRGTTQCYGDVIAYYTPSDKQIKENIKILVSPLDKIDKISGYEFKFNDKAPNHLQGKQSYGVIAQELEEVLPAAVEFRGEENIKGVNYELIIPLLIEGVKELRKEIKQLKNEI